MSEDTFAPDSVEEFKRTLTYRLSSLLEAERLGSIVMPIGICLVLSEADGGNAVASEMIKRFHVLNNDSKTSIDFYYLGWSVTDPGNRLEFSSWDYSNAKEFLRSGGVIARSSNADLILVDAYLAPGRPAQLRFESAINIDLTQLLDSEGSKFTLGSFLSLLIEEAGEVRGFDNPTSRLSNRLGLAVAKAGLLTSLWHKLGAAIGAEQLSHLAIRGGGITLALE